MFLSRPTGFKKGVTLYASEDIHGYVSPTEKGVIVPKGTHGTTETAGTRALNALFDNGERVLCTYDMVTLTRPILTPEEHYAKEYNDGLKELRDKGIQIGDTVRMSWGTCPDTYGKVLGFSQDNPAWLSVEEYSSPTKRFTIAVNNCVKVGCTAIVPYIPTPVQEPTITPVKYVLPSPDEDEELAWVRRVNKLVREVDEKIKDLAGWVHPTAIFNDDMVKAKTREFILTASNGKYASTSEIMADQQPVSAPEPALTLGIPSTYRYATFQELVDDLVEQLEDDELDLCWDERDYALIFRQNAHLISPAALMLLALQGETHTKLALSLMGVSDDKTYTPDLIEVWYHAEDIDVWELADWALRNLDKQAHTACRWMQVAWRWQFAVKLFKTARTLKAQPRVDTWATQQMVMF